jgi:hypothetical protein
LVDRDSCRGAIDSFVISHQPYLPRSSLSVLILYYSSVPSLILQAAQAAAQADGVLETPPAPVKSEPGITAASAVLQQAKAAVQQQQQQTAQQRKPKASGGGSGGGGSGGGNNKNKGPPLRRGKWTPEEEAYAARLITEFKAGLLPLTDGTTLRTFLSKLLNCDPMRISKKFVGSNCIGKQVFRRRTNDMNRLTPDQIQQSRVELSELERRFLERVAQTNRVKNSGVAAAKVDAAAAVSSSMVGGTADHAVAASAAHGNNNNNMNHMNHNGHYNNTNGHVHNNGINMNHNNMNNNNNNVGGLTPQQQQLQQVISNPPWLQPPNGYRHGMGAAMAAGNARAAAAGRALLMATGAFNNNNNNNGHQQHQHHHHNNNNTTNATTNNILAELQRQASLSSALQNHPLLAAVSGSSSAALQQLARNASGTFFRCIYIYILCL